MWKSQGTKIGYFTVWPSHDNSDSIDLFCSDVGDITTHLDDIHENNGVKVITTHLMDIHENSDVKIDDALTEWDIIKYNVYGRKVEAGQYKYEPYIIHYIVVVYS